MTKTNLQNLFSRPLVDLGGRNPSLSGIYSPIYKKREIRRFMTSYYESEKQAQEQANKFDMFAYYHALIDEALVKMHFSRQKADNLTILDVGCGFGSTTFPLLKLFPNSKIIASELSLAMLEILKNKLSNHKKRENCTLLQLNAEEIKDFKKNSFDLIVGAAILHHLIEPEKAIQGCAKILKPKGTAIFFEPFDEGTSMMALIYQTIIYHGKFKWLNYSTKQSFRNMVSTWEKMKDENKRHPFFSQVDDKWLFRKKYFFDLAKKYSFKQCHIYRLDKSPNPFTALAKVYFANMNLPDWIYEVIKEYENWLSPDLKDELVAEGCVILQR